MATTSLVGLFPGQSSNESFPPTLNLIDAKIVAELQAKGFSSSVYSRSGNTITLVQTDGKQLIVRIDEFGRAKEVKQLASDGSVTKHFTHSYGSYSAPLNVRNLNSAGMKMFAIVNYNDSQQLYNVVDHVNGQTHAITPPVSPYPSILNSVPPPTAEEPNDAHLQDPPSAAVQACWNGCQNAFEQAKANAYSDLAIATATALAVYLAALLVCLASTAFYPVCAAGFYAAYAATIATATAAWLAALKNANDALIECLDACCVANGIPVGSWRTYIAIPVPILDPWLLPSSDDLN